MLVEGLVFLAGGAALYAFLAGLGFGAVARIAKTRDLAAMPSLAFLAGVALFSTACFALMQLGCPIRAGAIIATLVLGSLIPFRRLFAMASGEGLGRRMCRLVGRTLRANAVLLLFTCLVALLLTSPRYQIAYHGWLHLGVEHLLAFDLYPYLNPGLLNAPLERPLGGYVMVAAISSLLGGHSVAVNVCLRLAVMMATWSLARSLLRAAGCSRDVANLFPGFFYTSALLLPMGSLVLDGLRKPEVLCRAWHAQDVLRNVWLPRSFDFLSSLTCCLDKVISPEPHMLGVFLAACAVLGPLLLASRTAKAFCVGLATWGASFIYTPQLPLAGLGVGVVLAQEWLLRGRRAADLGPRLARSALLLLVSAVSLAYGASLQSRPSLEATLRVLGGHPPSIGAPHLANLFTPITCGLVLVLFCLPLWKGGTGRIWNRAAALAVVATVLLVLFVRLPAGLNYKWSFILPLLLLIALGPLVDRLGRLCRRPSVAVWAYGLVLVILPFGADLALRFHSGWFKEGIYPAEQGASAQERYYARLKPALLWLSRHSPADSYVLAFPFEPDGPRQTAAANFAPAFLAQRRFVYLGDAVYTDPLPGSRHVKDLAIAVYSGQPGESAAALRELAREADLWVLSVSPHEVDGEKAGMRLAWAEGDLRVYEMKRASGR